MSRAARERASIPSISPPARRPSSELSAANGCAGSRSSLDRQERRMAKGYWVAFYKSVSDPAALKDYVELAMPAFKAGGARFLARGNPAKVCEGGLEQRVVIIEFDSVEAAV